MASSPYTEDGVRYLPRRCVACGTPVIVAEEAMRVADPARWPRCGNCARADMPDIAFVVYGEPQPRGSKTVGVSKSGGRFVRDSSKKSYPWMKDVAQAAGIAMIGKPLVVGAVRVELDFYRARPKGHYGSGKNADVLKASAPDLPITAPDAGKLARGTQDAMKSIVYRDDSQIVDERHRKFYGTPARCEVRIYVL